MENQTDTVFSRAAEAVGGRLLQEVTGSFKRLFKIHYDPQQTIEQAPEWQELDKLFFDACDTYVNIAMCNRRKIRGDLFKWVKGKIDSDHDAISLQHFGCDRNGHFRYTASAGGVAKRADTWSANSHMGWMNEALVFSVFRSNAERATSVALGHAAIRIASEGATHLQHATKETPGGRSRSQARFSPMYSSVPLSEFETMVGKLMVQARRECPTKYLPQTEILRIAALLDHKDLPVRSNLEREAARMMAEYNKQHPTGAIKSWRTALGHPKFRRAVRKRFSRAEEKYKKASLSVVAKSAGTPRTAI